MKLWKGRFCGEIDKAADHFNSSISFDLRLFEQDITGSIAHSKMLGKCGIIDAAESEKIAACLEDILSDIKKGALEIDMQCEDIHSFIEAELTKRLGDTGKRLHTARSRNDQVALDLKLYLKSQIDEINQKLKKLIAVLCDKAQQNIKSYMPGYTHLQRAQPITFAHHLMAYCEMFLRNIDRLNDAKKRMDVSPLGSGALAGTTYDIDRVQVAGDLGFAGVTQNSLDGVSDRDFVIETAAALSIVMVHLSRFSEEVILWCSHEFNFIELDDAFCTGSSIMPQKKNPDIAELVRGKSGRVFGNLMALLTVMKGLPLAYNKDMQEDKEAIFDSIDTVKACLDAFTPMIDTARVNVQNMRAAALEGFVNATDCADYLVKKGMPFRDAYKVVGQLVSYCIERGKTLDSLELWEYKQASDMFEKDIYDAISLENSVNNRRVVGGPSPRCVVEQIERVKKKISE